MKKNPYDLTDKQLDEVQRGNVLGGRVVDGKFHADWNYDINLDEATFEDSEINIELDEKLFNELRETKIIHWDRYLEKWPFTNPGFITLSTKKRTEVEG